MKPITVKELIKILKKLPNDALVVRQDLERGSNYFDPRDIYVEKVENPFEESLFCGDEEIITEGTIRVYL